MARLGQPAGVLAGEPHRGRFGVPALAGTAGGWAQVAALSLLAHVLLLSPTVYMLQVFDRVMVSQGALTLLLLSLLTLGLFVILAWVESLRTRVLIAMGLALDRRWTPLVFAACFQRQLRADVPDAHEPLNDVQQLRQCLTGPGVLAFIDAPFIPLYLTVLFLLHPALAGLGLLFVLVQLVLVWGGQRQTVTGAERASAAGAEAAAFLRDKLRHADLIDGMGMRDVLRQRWQALTHGAHAAGAQAAVTTHSVAAWSKSLRYAQQSLTLAAGALLVIDGQLSAGAMLAANLLVTRALAPIDQFVSGWRGLAAARASWMRLDALLQRYPPEPAACTGSVVPADRGAVELRNASATVAGRQQAVLADLQLTLASGTCLVVQGPSGSGKSTLARVLVGAWPALHGEVLAGGRPLSQWDRATLGAQTGYLPQDIELLTGSVADNIARHGAVDPERVVAAARAADLHGLILRLPQGYDTPVGEAGRALSGGQRQRIGLARALYGWPALVVLDEPDAHLDEQGEQALRQAVLALKAQGRTVVLISHQPAWLALADRLLVLADGRVVSDRLLGQAPAHWHK
jgi:ATP-binding cassette subfamily C exporter for protease/lipase